MTILMAMSVYPSEGKPYSLMVADSMRTEVYYNSNKEFGDYEFAGQAFKQDVQKLHKINKNLIIGFEGEFRGRIHHKLISNLNNIINPTDNLHAIHNKVVKEIINLFPKGQLLEEAQYSMIMSGFIDGIPSLSKTVFRDNEIVENRFQTPNKGNFSIIFDPHVTPEMAEQFREKVKYYNSVSFFRKEFVNLAKAASKYSTGSNDNIKVERLK
ncbi:hypothetical protein E3U55_09985 [Filobacillus milosensis]|uniref:Uncharacterized protein n=1 Tax=Filobacillus milosensis TaxID=94137 RepID=A0A4Y8IMA6_9BACI|nr:hypothetical protein [Filobacillus milosensis]TFB21138.1 hypothetical protein E3U55_09985 [Filobacillus milosensis]